MAENTPCVKTIFSAFANKPCLALKEALFASEGRLACDANKASLQNSKRWLDCDFILGEDN